MSPDQIVSFIEDYTLHSALWDMTDKDYTNKMKRNDAYTVLATKYNMTVKGVKNKIKSLRSYFSKEHQKVTEKKSGAGADDKYDSPWFANKSMLFILDSVTPRSTKESLIPGGSTRNYEGNSQVDTEIPGTSEESNDDVQAEDNLPRLINEENSTGKPKETNEPRPDKFSHSSANENNFARPPIKTKRNVKKRSHEDDRKEEEAIQFLKVAANELSAKDEFTIFGQMIASQIRKLNKRNQALAKNRIQNYIFELEMEEINTASSNETVQLHGVNYSSSSTSASPLQSPGTPTSSDYSQPPTPQYPNTAHQDLQEYLLFDLDNNK